MPQLRSVIACILPIFAPDMFATLGWGWGGTLLALVALVAVPAPVVVSPILKFRMQIDTERSDVHMG